MIEVKNKSSRDLLAELCLIIGGYIVGEQIIHHFLSLSKGILPEWALFLLAILLIITAIEIRNNVNIFWTVVPIVLPVGGSILLVLIGNNLITNKTVLLATVIMFAFAIIGHMVLILKRKNIEDNTYLQNRT